MNQNKPCSVCGCPVRSKVWSDFCEHGHRQEPDPVNILGQSLATPLDRHLRNLEWIESMQLHDFYPIESATRKTRDEVARFLRNLWSINVMSPQ